MAAKKRKRKWSGKVVTGWSPTPGLFLRSAEDIATILAKESESYAQAVSRLFFYRNRAGRTLSKSRLRVLNRAHEMLAYIFGK